MLRTSVRALNPILLLLAAAPAAGVAPEAQDTSTPPEALAASVSSAPRQSQLEDGTRAGHWTLPNGLRVVSRHLPEARSAAVTLCYRLGSREDPEGREGLAELAAQAAFTARSGDVPARTMAELDQLRPGGWSLKVGPHLTELTEACPTELLPGVLHQVCQRLRGLSVDASLVQLSREGARRRLSQNYDTQPDKTLYFLTAAIAAGRKPEHAMRYATGEGLAGVTARDVTALLGERLVPSNTVLCVVGNLNGLDLGTLIERELGSVPAGKPAPPVTWTRVLPAVVNLSRPDLRKPMGTVAVIAPALTDTTHPYFTAFTISAAGLMSRSWGRPDPPLASRFHYSISTDPELVRFYPPVGSSVDAGRTLTAILDQTGEAIVDSASIRVAAESMMWLTGGALPADLLKRAFGDATVIHTLATTLAALEAFGDEAFWTAYRARLARATLLDLGPFFAWYGDPNRRIVLMLRPQN